MFSGLGGTLDCVSKRPSFNNLPPSHSVQGPVSQAVAWAGLFHGKFPALSTSSSTFCVPVPIPWSAWLLRISLHALPQGSGKPGVTGLQSTALAGMRNTGPSAQPPLSQPHPWRGCSCHRVAGCSLAGWRLREGFRAQEGHRQCSCPVGPSPLSPPQETSGWSSLITCSSRVE